MAKRKFLSLRREAAAPLTFIYTLFWTGGFRGAWSCQARPGHPGSLRGRCGGWVRAGLWLRPRSYTFGGTS